ncbi:hypothetical protein ACQ4PT_002925 [Festuca glaucescens]
MPPRRLSAKRRRCRATEAAAVEADALISLPADVLDDILTRVGIRDTVRTSALSRAWRRRWEALSSLDLSFPSPVYDEGPPEGLWAIDCILLRFPRRVRRFCADLDNTYAGHIHDWLRVLSRRGIEILDLRFGYGFALPSSVFSCSRLTSLSLSSCAIPLLPLGFVAFPELRSLTLGKLKAIRPETVFGALRETCGLWSEFTFYETVLLSYAVSTGLEMQHAENSFSRNYLLEIKRLVVSTITVVRHVM